LHQTALNENSILAPGGLFYDKTHTWAFMEENGQVKIGINDFLQHVTGVIKQQNEELLTNLMNESFQLEITRHLIDSI